MKRIRIVIAAAVSMVALAGCMHRGVENVAAGDIAIDSLSATRTAVLRVNNTSTSTVRLYMVMPGMQPGYVARAEPGQIRTWVLDPNMFPASAVSLEARVENGVTTRIGPYKVNKAEVIDVTIPEDPSTIRAEVHKSM